MPVTGKASVSPRPPSRGSRPPSRGPCPPSRGPCSPCAAIAALLRARVSLPCWQHRPGRQDVKHFVIWLGYLHSCGRDRAAELYIMYRFCRAGKRATVNTGKGAMVNTRGRRPAEHPGKGATLNTRGRRPAEHPGKGATVNTRGKGPREHPRKEPW